MKKVVLNIVALVLALLSVWFVLSCVEVLTKNLSDNNLFAVLADERKSYGTYADGIVTTIDGHTWYYDCSYTDGTPVKVYFDDNNTDDVTDDVITRLREFK